MDTAQTPTDTQQPQEAPLVETTQPQAETNVEAPKNAGRPLTFKSAEELQTKIDEYFSWCDNKTKEVHSDKLGDMILPDPQPYTMSGLARRLGIDRDTLINYSHKQDYSALIRAAREKVHEDVETRLMATRNEKGAIFNLKNNFGWKDKNETDVTSKGEKLEPMQIVIVEEKRSSEPNE